MNFQSHACNMSHKIILSYIFTQAKKILTLESTFTVNDLPQEHPSGLRLNSCLKAEKRQLLYFNRHLNFNKRTAAHFPLRQIL